MDIHQARTDSIQEEIKAKKDIHQEKMEAAIQSIQSELEETIKNIGWKMSRHVSTKRRRACARN
jgi:predicted ATP-binding protein involved in virulence